MPLLSAALVTLALLFPLQPEPAKDFRAQMQAAGQRVRGVMAQSEALLADGKRQEATDLILAAFPEDTRTPAECLVLANVLFKQERALSYQLHQRAARELPDELEAQYEWALDQHRAGEYAAAATTYAKVIAAMPDRAPILGLMAECMIRTGKDAQAVEFWLRSEKAKTGTLEELESLLCELHGPDSPQSRRAALLPAADKGDTPAIEGLIALDTAWERDWWNTGPNAKLLARDLTRIRALALPDPRTIAPAVCVAECALAADAGESVKDPLLKRGFLIDPNHTIPENGLLLSRLLDLAIEHEAISKDDARAFLAEKTLTLARKTKDPEAFNAAAYLFLGHERLAEIDAEAWAAAPDPRFAGSWLAGAAAKNQLKLDSPELVKALAQFPDNAIIAGIAVQIARQEGKPLRPYLVRAIKAEYTRLSPGGFIPRPSAAALRSYFKALALELVPAQPPPPPAKS